MLKLVGQQDDTFSSLIEALQAVALEKHDVAITGLVHDLVQRFQSRQSGQGVFSPFSVGLARELLYGNGDSFEDLAADQQLGTGWQARLWVAVVFEIVPRETPWTVLEALVDQSLLGSALGIREHDHGRRVLSLTLLFHDRSAARVERSAVDQTRRLLSAFEELGLWAASGVGTAAYVDDMAVSLQRARLALGYALVRGPGVHLFSGEQEVTGLPCTDLASYMEQFLSRIQSGGNWKDLVGSFFDALRACASARRLQQEVQRLFSCIADLIPISARVERFYHIVDFVHGPDELRAELEALCVLAAEAVRINGRSLADRKLDEFQDYVARHYGDWRLDLALVCSALQISPSYLSKILRRSLKTTFVEYVTETRMARSRELLTGTDLLTSQIAEQVGYVYTHYFSATFKKRYATTPSEFRTGCRSQSPEARTPESAAV